MATHRRYMPLYVAEFLGDTTHLDATAVGAYLLLIMHYWQHGGLPTDHESLRLIARLTPHNWRKFLPVISAFFLPGWRHKRVDHELQVADAKHEKLSAAGVIGRAKQRARPGPGSGQATHLYNRYITSTESVPREASRESKTVPVTDTLRETIERKGWTK